MVMKISPGTRFDPNVAKNFVVGRIANPSITETHTDRNSAVTHHPWCDHHTTATLVQTMAGSLQYGDVENQCSDLHFAAREPAMWRHGDVLIQSCDSVPQDAKRLPHCTLAKGELTGHAHRIQEPGAAALYESGDQRYLAVIAERASLIHQEHAPITLPRGVYRVWIQREYTPREIRRVLD
jgi:hypothetical protein